VGGWQRGSGETVHSSDTHLYSYCGACVPLRTSRSNDGFCSATHALAATLATAAYRATASCTREVTPRGTSKTPISLEAMKQKVDAMGGKRLAAGRVSVCRKGSGWIDTSDAPSSARQSALEWARTVGDLVWERACVQILFAVTDRVNNRIRIKRAFWKKCIQQPFDCLPGRISWWSRPPLDQAGSRLRALHSFPSPPSSKVVCARLTSGIRMATWSRTLVIRCHRQIDCKMVCWCCGLARQWRWGSSWPAGH
jgi:hypothetical protein